MEPNLIMLALLAALVGAAVLGIARLVRLDRPASPPPTTTDDWRDNALAWRHLGIR